MIVTPQARPGAEVHAHLVAGDPRDELPAFADKINAEAIVVGSRGFGAVKRALLGEYLAGPGEGGGGGGLFAEPYTAYLYVIIACYVRCRCLMPDPQAR